jgi:hypothetical protein
VRVLEQIVGADHAHVPLPRTVHKTAANSMSETGTLARGLPRRLSQRDCACAHRLVMARLPSELLVM